MMQRRNLFDCAYLIEKATNNSEKIYTSLENYPQLKLSYFSILIIRFKNHLGL
jgi:precorrin-2/cobalt-factor-2 C20-methyltransferase